MLSKLHKGSGDYLPSLIGVLVAFKSDPDGGDYIVINRLSDEMKELGLIEIRQGKAPTEELSVRRNTVETFKNPNSKNHLKPGSILQFDQVNISTSGNKADCVFIKDLYSYDTKDERSVLVGYVKPLPQRAGQETAWAELILPQNKHIVNNARDLYRAILMSWSEAYKYCEEQGLSEYGRGVIVLSDNQNSKPYTIFINPVKDTNGTVTIYRQPNADELKNQILSNESLKQIFSAYQSGANDEINVMPGVRIMVPSKTASSDRYNKVIEGHKALFKIKVSDKNDLEEQEHIGYKKSILGLWKGMINSISSTTTERARLNEQESTIGYKPGDVNKVRAHNEMNKLGTVKSSAAEALQNLKQSEQKEKSDVKADSGMPPDAESGYTEVKGELNYSEDYENYAAMESVSKIETINHNTKDDIDEFLEFSEEIGSLERNESNAMNEEKAASYFNSLE